MPSEIRIHEGEILEFADKGKFQLGVAVSTDEKTGKVKLIHISGRDMALPVKQILHCFPSRISTSLPISNITNELKSIDTRADGFQEKCDIEELWQLVNGEYEEISLQDLVSLSFEDAGTIQMLAMVRALRNDRIFFKAIQPERFAPRPSDVVADLQRQRELKAQKEAWRQKFVEQAIQMLNMDDESRLAAVEDGYFEHSDVLDAWKIIEQYAVNGVVYQEKAEAELLMEMLQNRINKGFSGTAHLRARAFLLASGYWEPDTNVALIKYEIPVQFDEMTEREAFSCYQNNAPAPNRRDLTHLNVFSIDDVGTLDIDDALSIEKLEDGNYRLGVHIAAPAASIPFNSALEISARHRATSIYLPERRIPMMPAILSENAISLIPNEKRNTISFLMTFDQEFNIIEQEIIPSVIRSRHALSYDAVEHLIEHGNDELSDEIRIIQEFCEFSAANRRNHGAIDIDLPEYKLSLNTETGLYKLEPIDTRMMSRQLVAECMILANALAAEFCFEHEIPSIYRIQPPPNNMPRQDTLDAMPNDMFRAFAMRKCMMPASTSMTPELHAGLGLPRYLQATSPIRRYTDLICHYQLEHWFTNHEPRFSSDEFNTVLSETDHGLSNARSASHESYQTATLLYLKQLGNEPLDAMILQYNSERGDIAQVVLCQTQVRANVTTKTRLPLGTMCRVRIDNVRPEEGVILLQFIDTCSSDSK